MIRFSRNLPALRGLQRSRLSKSLVCNNFRFNTVVGSRAYVSAPPAQDTFLQGDAANYVDEMYEAWLKDPKSVHISWNAYFSNLQGGRPSATAFVAPPTLIPGPVGSLSMLPNSQTSGNEDIVTHLKAQLMVRAYEVRGHQKAHLDPLHIAFGDANDLHIPLELTPGYYGFTEADMNKDIALGPGILPNFAKLGVSTMKLKDLIATCEKIYCSTYSVEYIHIPSRERCDWIRERVEIPEAFKFTPDQKRQILDRLVWSCEFENFLSTKYPNDKRFGLEGAESVVPGMKALIDTSVDLGIEDIVIGMPHRGRLNMLTNVVRKPAEAIFSEFSGSTAQDEGSGDVKYHLGMNYCRPTTSGKSVNLSIVANPSHLEAEDPVVLGRTRAIQHFKNDVGEFNKAMSVLFHGDAAVAAQGVVYESMGFSHLPAYSTGGTIHIIVNNQIGFTTDPQFGRSTRYASDIAKAFNAPVFHVNADDVEAVTFMFNLAAEWRETFHSDVFLDVVGYRKHGHNETDQPSFTQPLMYKQIAKKKSVLDMYVKQLLKEGVFTQEDIEEHKQWVWKTLQTSLDKAKDYTPETREWLTSPWEGFKSPRQLAHEILPHLPTAVDESTLKKIGEVISTPPEGFKVHRNLKRILKSRLKSVESGEGIDWSTGEALAFGSLALEGYHLRITGQDVERGTFSQRHAVLHDQDTGATYVPLKHIGAKQGDFVISNSSLSEFGVLGYEYGYSLASPDSYVEWEAQFGDFANNAQCIMDQFISSAESKWKQRSGMVLSLPHGYDGQGPEHSSARIERYLQMCNEDPRFFPSEDKLERQHQDCNMQVTYPTTPANLFHLMRRQMHRQFRKPLIIFFSKSLLRHPLARSALSEFTGDSHFQWIIEDSELGKSIKNKSEIKRLVLCSGQVYATLVKKREDLGDTDTAFIKVEQLHPFPYALLKEAFQSYPAVEDLVWCQEEPLNMGAWSYMYPRMNSTLKEAGVDIPLRYAGRDPSASIAAGNKKKHHAEEEAFLAEVWKS
ncbi:2-oxoglutarate dehydrogenase E1 component [Brettanomyces nanus]|uniref:2-oxoglutarate dehydrogenase, mitochondrial n=1 Tax=Eeniella nana TaxID=13502 RepID=A0A875SA08_EENNA|nr:2-oxoglutarate dehydrogenase E1 component [Brettanomyces nanus]QPG76429.1 2-oxoglutarate dehydrogenase E1 component [Brettanomyces nanus]